MQSDFNDMMGFKSAVQKDEKEQQKIRAIPRKGAHPKANTKNYTDENKQFGETNDVDLVMQRINGQKKRSDEDRKTAEGKFGRGTI